MGEIDYPLFRVREGGLNYLFGKLKQNFEMSTNIVISFLSFFYFLILLAFLLSLLIILELNLIT
jgi:nucleoside recognition membrane protein YjiH